MKLSRILILLGLGAHAVTLLLYFGMGASPAMKGMGTLFVLFFFPAIWLIVFVLAIIAVVSFRKTSLPDSTVLRVLGFLLCTPIFLIGALGVYMAMLPDDLPAKVEIDTTPSVEYWYGTAYKFQWQKNYKGADYALTRYIADSVDVVSRGDAAYQKDSLWIYFRGETLDDTLMLEYYKRDSLVRTIDLRKDSIGH
jgi:heme/copper-type cytochrome/quinol oxidase subunit 2